MVVIHDSSVPAISETPKNSLAVAGNIRGHEHPEKYHNDGTTFEVETGLGGNVK